VCFTALQATARTVFAFSRDGLLPVSHFWTKVNRFTGTPINSVWLTVFFCIAINLIGLGSYTAIAGVFNVCAIALDISYCIPIICKLLFGKFERGPWHMGKASPYINAWACLWTLFVSIIFILPTARPVAADTMNYAIVYFVAIIAFALLFWYVKGKSYYTGPVKETGGVSAQSLTPEETLVGEDKKDVVA
jgi:amino acid transporter